MADDFTQQALDRALLDNAYGVASRVRQQGSDLDLDLTSEELDVLLFDQTETQFYAVWRADGSLLAGDETLLPARPARPVPRSGFRPSLMGAAACGR